MGLAEGPDASKSSLASCDSDNHGGGAGPGASLENRVAVPEPGASFDGTTTCTYRSDRSPGDYHEDSLRNG